MRSTIAWRLLVVAAAAVAGGGFGLQWRHQRTLAARADAARLARELAVRQAHFEVVRAEVVEGATRTHEPTPPPTDSLEPARLLNELQQMRVRRGPLGLAELEAVAFRLRGLRSAGDSAVPAIREYLAKFEDLEYPSDREHGPDVSLNPPEVASKTDPRGLVREPVAREDRLRFVFPTPPSLRMWLLGVLADVGTRAAEATLADVLRTTGRGIEVAVVTRKLEGLAPNRYREAALNAAKELLVKPLVLAGNSRFDDLQRPYLYSVLNFYNDGSFVGQVPPLLVNAAGRLDREALSYLTKTLGRDQALPWIYQAFTNAALTHPADRSRLLQTAIPAAGTDPYANAILRHVLNHGALPVQIRGFVVQNLAQRAAMDERSDRSHSPRAGGETRPERAAALLQSKLEFLDQLRSEYSDPVLIHAMEKTARDLEQQLRRSADTPANGVRRDPRLH